MSDTGQTLCPEGHIREEDGEPCPSCQSRQQEQLEDARDPLDEARRIIDKTTLLLPQRSHLVALLNVSERQQIHLATYRDVLRRAEKHLSLFCPDRYHGKETLFLLLAIRNAFKDEEARH